MMALGTTGRSAYWTRHGTDPLQRVDDGRQLALATPVRLVHDRLDRLVILFRGGHDQHLVGRIAADRRVGHDRGECGDDRGGIGQLQGVGFGHERAVAASVGLVDNRLDPFVFLGRGGDDQNLAVRIRAHRGPGHDRLDRRGHRRGVGLFQDVGFGHQFAPLVAVELVEQHLDASLVFGRGRHGQRAVGRVHGDAGRGDQRSHGRAGSRRIGPFQPVHFGDRHVRRGQLLDQLAEGGCQFLLACLRPAHNKAVGGRADLNRQILEVVRAQRLVERRDVRFLLVVLVHFDDLIGSGNGRLQLIEHALHQFVLLRIGPDDQPSRDGHRRILELAHCLVQHGGASVDATSASS